MFISDLFEAQAKQTLVLIPGGFHPFHPGHLSLYRSAETAFPGATIVYVATDDRKDRPFPFAEKQKLAQIAGVKPQNFQLVRSPFVAKEVTEKFDPNTTVLIFARSEKDRDEQPKPGGVKKDGSPAYLQPYQKGNLAPMSQHGYMAYLPVVQFDAGPSGVTSATQIRDMWPKANDQQKNEIVTDLYPKNPRLAKQILDKYLGGAVAEGTEEDGYSDKFVQSQIDYYKKHILSGNAGDRERINGSMNYYQHIKNKRIKNGTWSLEQGVAEGADNRSFLEKVDDYLVDYTAQSKGNEYVWIKGNKAISIELDPTDPGVINWAVGTARGSKIDWLESGNDGESEAVRIIKAFNKQGVAEGKYKCTCHPGDSDPDCPVHGLEPMEVGDALDERSVSKAQFRTMAAAAHNPKFAKKVGISQNVAKEFHSADKKQSYKNLPSKVEEESSAQDPNVIQLKKRARVAHPFASSDEEALALYINDREIKDVDALEREQNRELKMINRIEDGENQLQREIDHIDRELAALTQALKAR